MPTMMRLYAKFLMQILNDQEGGANILQKQLEMF